MSIQLIQTIYNLEFTQLNSEINYKQLLMEIEYFGITSQIYFLLSKNGQLKNTPKFFQTRLKEKYVKNLYVNMFIHHQTSIVLHAFESYNLDVIPLKGTIFAEQYFGNIGARPTSDIDLLIHQQDLQSVINCIKKMGFTLEQNPIPSHFHCSFSKTLPNSPIPLTMELHWNIIKENTAQLSIEEFWQEAVPYKNFHHVKVLSDHHTFYFACLHGWRHNLDSLKYFIDLIQLICKSPPDLIMLLNDATAHKTLKRVVRTLSITYKHFPFLNELAALPQKRHVLFWDYEVFLNPKKRKMKQYIDFIDYQIFSYDQWKHCFSAFSDWLQTSK